MTVSTTDSEIDYQGDGTTTSFPVPFRFLQNGDLIVTKVSADGSSVTLAIGTDYTVSGAGAQSGGTVLMTVAPASGVDINISRVLEAVQETDLRNQGRFYAETLENVFDYLTMLIQQGASGLSRALKHPAGYEHYQAEARRIENLEDPVNLQDAATKSWAQQFVASILATGQGPINNAANILYLAPDGSVHNAQELSSTDPTKGASLIGNAVTLGTNQTITGRKSFSKVQSAVGWAQQIIADSAPLDYGTTVAASVLQWRDASNRNTNQLVPGAVFQFNSTGDGTVNSSAELSQTIWQGLFGYMNKTGDGSAHCFTGIGQLGATGAGGYNELGAFQAELTNVGSALGTMSGVEMLLKDSPDGGVSTYSTKMQAVVGRLAKYNPTIRKSYNFYASSEGNLPPNGIIGVNGGGLHQWQRGIDFQGASFSTGQFLLAPNNTSMAWLDSTGVAKPIMGLDSANGVFIKAAGSGVYFQDSSGNSKIGVSAAGIAALQNATVSASATTGTSGALPAQVAGYVTVVINGTAFKLPYYN